MDLLPKSHQEFSQSDYWNKFFKSRGEKSFEWYGEYSELCGQLHKYIKPKDNILVTGCGNSRLSLDLYDMGYRNITNIDISHIVIKQMLESNKVQRSEMKFIQMDATKLSFDNGEFSVVLDKGTLDALMTDNSEKTIEIVNNYCEEIYRVLRNTGRYVCISLLQEHILKYLVDFFPNKSCMVRIVRCFEAEKRNSDNSSEGLIMPVYVIVITKFTNLKQKILEISTDGEIIKRVETENEIIENVQCAQNTALACNGLNKTNISDQNEIKFDLYKAGNDIPRFTVYILDQPPLRKNGKYAAFIVPQGREIEWLFSTPQGRKKLLSSANHNRLAIVTMNREHKYTNWDDVKNELSESIKNFAPHGLKEKIPYLSLGAEVGNLEIIHRGKSDISGDFIIEDAEKNDNKLFRRLIFLNNQFVIQSEALIKIVSQNNKGTVKRVDKTFLPCMHHVFMAIGVYLTTIDMSKNLNKILVIGLGGGGLCTFIHTVMKNTNIIAVEIDNTMVEIAEKYFELRQDDRLKVVVDDGLLYLQKNVTLGNQFKAILFDIDSKDSTLGMSCPPQSFIDEKTLKNVKILLDKNGVFILNLVCRDETLRDEVIETLKKQFNIIFFYKLDEDVNEIIYCFNNCQDSKELKQKFRIASENFNAKVKKIRSSSSNTIDITSFLEELKIS